MSSAESSRDLIEVLGEDFARRLRLGELPSIDEYAEQHPDRAEDIRELLPTVVALEQARARRHSRPLLSLRDCPRQLGDFRLLTEIGRGGMGVVYEAEQLSLERRVAVKVLPRDTSAGAEDRLRRFHREARMAAQLHHTNIVPVFGVGEASGFHYLVMQRIDGLSLDKVLANLATESEREARPAAPSGEENLRPWLSSVLGSDSTQDHRPARGGPPRGLAESARSRPSSGAAGGPSSVSSSSLSGRLIQALGDGVGTVRMNSLMQTAYGRDYWRRVAETTADAAEAIHFAHEQGILHRDIKPANLLLDAEGVVWVADFGLAQVFEVDASRTEDLAGTLRYMAPERFEGRCDIRSDVYSLGATLYEMLTLRPAFRTSDRPEMIHAIQQVGAVPPDKRRDDVPRDLATICMKAMALAPQDRYANAGELADDLRRFASDRPIAARRATAIEQSWRWCRRNQAVAISTFLAIAMLAVTSIVSTQAYYRTREALDQNVQQQQRTLNAMALSFDALDRLYSRFAPDDMYLASLPAVDSGDMAGLAGTDRPMLSDQAGAMLENLLEVYDQFAAQVGEREEVLRRKLISSRRLGVIQTRLGQFERAENTFLAALQRWPDENAPEMIVEKARLFNSLGGLYDFQQRRGDARLAYRQALVTTESLPSGGLEQEMTREEQRVYEAAAYTTAQSCFLLGRSMQFFGSGAFVSSSQRSYLLDAIQLLEPICKSDGGDASADGAEAGGPAPFRRLLALCYRDLSPEPMSPNVDRSIGILSQLCDESPENLSYRYDLSETLGLPASRRASIPELELARLRLLDALQLSDSLVDAQPNLPLYAESRSHLHRKLANVLLEMGERVEAAQHADLAVSIQQNLLRRFPDSVNYRVWVAVMTEMRARAEADESNLSLAIFELENVVEELTELLHSQPDSPLIAGPLASAYLTLARIQFQQLDPVAARTSLMKAFEMRAISSVPVTDFN